VAANYACSQLSRTGGGAEAPLHVHLGVPNERPQPLRVRSPPWAEPSVPDFGSVKRIDRALSAEAEALR
jgi:hypothetical protein